MPIIEELSILILVKASPVLTSNLEESVCVAGITNDTPPRWVRLNPVPFRDLGPESKFRKYQWITVGVRRPQRNVDTRAETRKPIPNTITLGETIDTADGWARRRMLVESLGEPMTMCALNEAQKAAYLSKTRDQDTSLFDDVPDREVPPQDNSKRTCIAPVTPSLSLMRVKGQPRLLITKRKKDQIHKWESGARAKEQRQSLFAENNGQTTTLEMCPWRFRYQYECLEPKCRGHEQTIIDWEIMALWRNVMDQPNWQDKMRQKFETQMWIGRDTMLFVGNQVGRPSQYLVLGVFWPPTRDQMMLDLIA